MSKKYTRAETVTQIAEAAKNMASFYRASCVNYGGVTYKSDGNEYYTEIVSEYLVHHYALFNQIPQIKRGNYQTDTHNGTTPRRTSNRLEERIALSLFQKELRPIGKMIDYQIPLKGLRNDDAGKIDLMAFDDASGILRLIELKAPKSQETLLRCVLEIYTYYKTVDISTLTDNYGLTGKCREVRICPLFFENRTSRQNEEYEKLYEHPYLVDFMHLISSRDVTVELLRFPFDDIDFMPQSNAGVNACCGGSDSSTEGTCKSNSKIKKVPMAEHPNGFPLARENFPDYDMLSSTIREVEILNY